MLALSLRAWEPVFASLEEALGAELFTRLRGDWRVGQSAAVRQAVSDPANRTWVAESAGQPVGFVTATASADNGLGEIVMVAVDPSRQRAGVGTELTGTALAWLRDRGMGVAMVETGGDAGHLPARRAYEAAGFTMLPVARFFKAL